MAKNRARCARLSSRRVFSSRSRARRARCRGPDLWASQRVDQARSKTRTCRCQARTLELLQRLQPSPNARRQRHKPTPRWCNSADAVPPRHHRSRCSREQVCCSQLALERQSQPASLVRLIAKPSRAQASTSLSASCRRSPLPRPRHRELGELRHPRSPPTRPRLGLILHAHPPRVAAGSHHGRCAQPRLARHGRRQSSGLRSAREMRARHLAA